MDSIFTSSQNASHPYFQIELSAQRWIMSQAQLDKEKPYPERWDTLSEALALPAYYFVYPAATPNGYCLVAADVQYYDFQICNLLADSSIATVAPFLSWHLQKTTNPTGFLEYVCTLVNTDFLSQQGLRSFEATYNWLESNKPVLGASVSAGVATLKRRALGHRECMLALDLLNVPDQLRSSDTSKKSAFLSHLIDFNQRKTEDILRAFREKTKFDPYVPKVIESLYSYCERADLLDTPLGQKVTKLWEETKSKGL